ncbi:carboxypeptidase Q-like isoform X2 [Artemia franciscana]|uniref:carboxypeptidase Q-like isoform X2 n=1 Tax=Artemia franciscana TaxID=6661 RepID=UPI0032D9E738
MVKELTKINRWTRDVAKKIISSCTGSGFYKGRTWRTLSHFVDNFGSRITGSKNLEHSIHFLEKKFKRLGLENVSKDPVAVPHWVRGEEMAAMIHPRFQPLSVIGLGPSVATPIEGIISEILVVKSFEELQNKTPNEVKGKIVVYNEEFESYGKTVIYRGLGAVEAAKLGAAAALVRSVTPFSIDSPHTGFTHYEEEVPKIPIACISIEGAELLQRLYNRGIKVIIHLKMLEKDLSPATSYNLMADIVGSKMPDQLIIISGHIDSWDVGQGAMDDGGGAFISWNALSLLHMLNLRPKRTIRTILWTGEEFGLLGANSYFEKNKSNLEKFTFVMESDMGTFRPTGLIFGGGDKGACIISKILTLFESINATSLVRSSDVSSDITFWTDAGIPGASILNENDKYFWFHHSNGDTMTVENPESLDLCLALWATTAFVIADMDEDFPRN